MAIEGVQLGQYRLVRLLGSGGMGEVYLAEDARIGQQVAIKVTRTEVASYPHSDSAKDALRLFQREAKAIARLDHPHILPLFGYGEENVNGLMLTYIVMPFRPEGSLANWLQQRGTAELLPVDDVVYFIHQAAGALQYAHDNQVIHQDVKPANFLLRTNKENPSRPDLLLTDFGIARVSSATANISHSIRGTPTYMAPEQWSGEPVYATDQYALAVMAYELLAGHSPFIGRQEQIMYQHLNVQPQPPSSFNQLLHKDVDTTIFQALAKQPENRFPSIATFAHALEQTAKGINAPMVGKPPITPHGGDLYATLAISKAEAATGTSRTLTLPGGRQVTVSVPAHTYDGQILRLEGLGEPSYGGGSRGTLILTLSVKETDATQLPSPGGGIDKTLPASNPGLRRDAVSSSSNSDSDRMPPGPNVSPFAPNITQAHLPNSTRRGISTGTAILLIGLALLVLVASFGFFYLQNINRSSTSNNSNTLATTTTQAQNATSFAITATAQTMHATAITNTQVPTTNPTGNTSETATGQVNSTATAISSLPNPYPPSVGKLAIYDPLRNNSGGYNWDLKPTQYGTCTFTNEGYDVAAPTTPTYHRCIAQNTSFSNFAYEVELAIIAGDCGAIIFRADATLYHYYYFHICQDGTYALWRYDHSGPQSTIFFQGSNPNIHQGLSQSNLLAVVANNNSINLYVNHQLINSIQDSMYAQGQIGVAAENETHPTEVVFKNAKVWTF